MIERPRDPEAMNQLVDGGLILGCLALSDMLGRRLRWLAYGAAGALAASGFTGFRPGVALLARFMGKNGHAEPEGGEIPEEQAVPTFGKQAMRQAPEETGTPRGRSTTGLGVPHRIPIDVMLESQTFERTLVVVDVDDRPAPSPDGDIGLAD